ncbi:MAG: InlB B-repeat-containing protein [Bacteroides sp.]|nr:InlB B-repeat-containing protein [Bacteroides sp.]MCM1531836.1 InlB B-repeat-containing protein [Ruminococcus flavefaciens]MCM1554788.1 InlB B-repeat-containing protein [Bacteroides sp.]
MKTTYIPFGRIFGLFWAILCFGMFVPKSSAQNINGTQQLKNRGFEEYDNLGTDNVEPTDWNSFMTANASGIASAGKARRLERVTERRPGTAGKYGMRVFSTEILGVNANGNVTTGRINMGSATATDASNHNFSDRASEGFNFPFTAVPDSMVVWARYAPKDASDQGQINAIIHGDNEPWDPGFKRSEIVALATVNPVKGSGGWVRYSVPFDREGCGQSVQDARYILVSITTNKQPGGGAAEVWVDDILFVYNPEMAIGRLPVASFNMRDGDASLSIPFTVSGTLPLDANSARKNRVVAELSDASGSFALPVEIGSVETEESGTLAATIPAGTPLGEHYKVRLRATDRDVYSQPCAEDIVLARGYTVKAESADESRGSVEGGGAYAEGAVATLKAIPYTGYHFDRWEENGRKVEGAGATYSFSVTSDRHLTAVFAINTYRLELLTEGNGKVINASGKSEFTHGERVGIEAVPDEGYDFAGYRSEGVLLSQSRTYSFNIVSDMRITAVFERGRVNIAAGTAQPDFGRVEGGGRYEVGGTVTLTAIPHNRYYYFVAWMEGRDTVSREPKYVFTAGKNRSLTAVFAQQYYTVTLSSNIEGAGELAGGGRFAASQNNTSIVLKAEPHTGYAFLYWKSDTDGTEHEDNPYTVLSSGRLTRSLSYTAYFDVERYTVDIESVPAGAGTLQGAGTYLFRDRVTLRATPQDHYAFTAWVRSDHGRSDTVRENPFSFTIEEGNARRYKALFSLKRHVVELSASPGKYGTVSGAGVYTHFDTALLQAEAGPGCEFLYWGVRRGLNIDNVSEENPWRVEVRGDMEMVAVFSERRKEVAAYCRPQGAGVLTGEGAYVSGSYAVLQAAPAYGYRFSHWEDGSGNRATTDYRLNLPVRNDTAVYARFEPLRYTFTLMTEGNSANGKTCIDGGEPASRHVREVRYGDTLRLRAQALAPGYRFIQWRLVYRDGNVMRDSLYSREAEEIFVVRGETYMLACFTADACHISAIVQPDPACGRVRNQGNYRRDLWIELVAEPEPGYDFSHWESMSGNRHPERSGRLQVQAVADTSVRAVFKPDTLQVQVEVWGGKANGTASGAARYAYGKEARLKAVPAYGYAFAGWYAAADTLMKTILSKESDYAFTVRRDESLAAAFAPVKFPLSAEIRPQGAGRVSGTGVYAYLSEAILRTYPEGGYALKHILAVRPQGRYDTLRESFAGFRMDTARSVIVVFEPTQYSLQVFSSDTGRGRVQSVPQTSMVGYDSTVLLQAGAYPDYRFSQWRDAWGRRISRANPFGLNVRGDTVVYAEFIPETKRLAAEPENPMHGTVADDYNQQPGYGSLEQVRALPADGYEFDRWVLEKDPQTVVSRSAVFSTLVLQDTAFVACFKPARRELHLYANMARAGRVWMETGRDGDTVNEGDYAQITHLDSVTLKAEPRDHYTFSEWIRRDTRAGGISLGEDSVLKIQVRSDMEVEAVFEPRTYRVQVQSEPSGFGSVQGGGIYDYGTTASVRAVCGEGYVFKGWRTSVGWISDSLTHAFSVNGDTLLTACFSRDTVCLEVYAGLGGSVQGGGAYLKGSTVQVQAQADGKYGFEAWYDGSGKRLSAQNPYSFTISGNTSLRAGFFPLMLTVDAEASEGGMVKGGGRVPYASSVFLEAIPDSGHRFVRWQGVPGLDEAQAVLPALGLWVSQDIRVTADFSPLKYRVQTHASPLGAGKVDRGGSFDYGMELSFEAMPDADHVFTAWTLDGKEVSSDPVLKVKVCGEADYVAVFAPKRYKVLTSVYPDHGGLAYGGGSYYWGDTAQIGIYLYDSVTFKNWSDADFNQVSVLPDYLYAVTHTEILTASVNAPGPRPNDTVDPGDTVQEERHFRVYPNPLREGDMLHIISDKENLLSIRLFTVTGKYVMYRRFSDHGAQSVALRLPQLQAGCYFYELRFTGGSRRRGKLIKL